MPLMLNAEDLADAPHHAVLGSPWTWRVVAVAFRCPLDEPDRVDLTFQRGNGLVMLRFFDVTEIEIEAGFPHAGSGLQILDVSDRGMDQARVHVCSFEQDPEIRFWARSVERVAVDP